MRICKYELEARRIVHAIYRQYRIRLDPDYAERIKRPICEALCGGKCSGSYIIEADDEENRTSLFTKEYLADMTGMNITDSVHSMHERLIHGDPRDEIFAIFEKENP